MKYRIYDFLAVSTILLVTLIITLLPVSLYKFGLYSAFLPSTEICLLYFFATHYSIWYLAIFLYGIFISEMYNTPIGVESLLFIITYYFLIKSRNLLLSRKPTSYLLGFIIALIFIDFGKYFLISSYYSYYINVNTILLQAFITILFFPAIDWIMSVISQKVWCDVK